MVPQSLIEAIGRLLAAGGKGEERFELAPLASGGNNRVFAVEAESGCYVAKWYYHDLPGGRDRARAEFEFLSHIWAFGVRNVQQPIAHDPAGHLALYGFVAGQRVQPGDVSPALVEEAARLFAAINAGPVRASGRHLPDASDACFTVEEHIQSVDRRIERLSAIERESENGREATVFVGELATAWMRVRRRVLADLPGSHRGLPESWRSLSPSDFGFHNAILRPNGEACFLDFEYAGWDDPAKMVGDFFSHPGAPVPADSFDRFVALALEPFAERERLFERVQRLRAVSRIRWCCIMLNEFLPDVATRRQFADPSADIGERQRRQLAKARSIFALADI